MNISIPSPNSLGLSDYLKGKLRVDEYVTHHRKLLEINEGFHDMHGGECIRCVVDMA